MQALKSTCKSKFDKYDQHVCCIAYVLNLAAQKTLVMLKADKVTDEDKLLQEQQNTQRIYNIILKISMFKDKLKLTILHFFFNIALKTHC